MDLNLKISKISFFSIIWIPGKDIPMNYYWKIVPYYPLKIIFWKIVPYFLLKNIFWKIVTYPLKIILWKIVTYYLLKIIFLKNYTVLSIKNCFYPTVHYPVILCLNAMVNHIFLVLNAQIYVRTVDLIMWGKYESRSLNLNSDKS